MGRLGKRIRLESGISSDGSGFAVRAKVGTQSRERRYPPSVDLPYLRAERAQLEAELRAERQEAGDVPAERGTWARDVVTYLSRVKSRLDPATYKSRVSELKAWTAILADRPRHQLRKSDVDRAIDAWRTAELSPKTIRHRIRTLKHLYSTLDGKRARTPADDVVLPALVKVRPLIVTVITVRRVIANLLRHERNGRLRDAKTRARFLVRITSGQRPAQIMRTTPRNVELDARLWQVPAAKGGEPVPLYLNDDMLVAWRLFVAANAWGKFDTVSQARVLRRAGWPADVPIYNARHTIGIAFSEAGEDLADIQAWMGHRHIQTTRDFYVPRLFSRLKAMSERANKRVDLNPRWARFVGTVTKPRTRKGLRRT